MYLKTQNKLVGLEGFEPPTHGLGNRGPAVHRVRRSAFPHDFPEALRFRLLWKSHLATFSGFPRIGDRQELGLKT